jgi:hypothetical protein
MAFADLAGTCTTPFSWSVDGADDVTVSPASGDSELTITVDVDESSVGEVYHPGVNPFGAYSLHADAHVHLESKDGVFVVDATVPAVYQGGGAYPAQLSPLRFQKSGDELGAKLSIQPKDRKTSAQLSFAINPIGYGCAGSVALETTMVLANSGGHGAVAGSSSEIASWSSTGCTLGQKAVKLDEPGKTGTSLADFLTNRWGHTTFMGAWDDGSRTITTVQLGPLPDSLCLDPVKAYQAEFSANVSYETADGRVKLHSATSDISVLSLEEQAPIDIRTNETFACDDPAVSQLDPSADCSTVDSITVQLDLDYYASPGGDKSGSITVSEASKGPDGPATTPGAKHRLQFDPN